MELTDNEMNDFCDKVIELLDGVELVKCIWLMDIACYKLMMNTPGLSAADRVDVYNRRLHGLVEAQCAFAFATAVQGGAA